MNLEIEFAVRKAYPHCAVTKQGVGSISTFY
jgi:hypothetical protein